MSKKSSSRWTMRLFGGLDIAASGPSQVEYPVSGQKRLACLAYLAAARPRGFQRRDKLLTLLWPESSNRSARNALSNLLHHLRAMLGPDALINRGDALIALNPAVITVDLWQFDRAMEQGQPAAALAQYKGELLDGFHVSAAAPEFEDWLQLEQTRYRDRAIHIATGLSRTAETNGDAHGAVSWARQAVEFDPCSEQVRLALIELLARLGERGTALSAFAVYRELLEREWGLQPAVELENLIRDLKNSGATRPLPDRDGRQQPGLAILPLLTSGEEDPSPWADLIRRDLARRLSTHWQIRLIADSATLALTEQTRQPCEIAAELDADWLLRGDIESEGADPEQTRLLIRLELWEAASGKATWQQTFESRANARALFDIEQQMSKAAAEAMSAARANRPADAGPGDGPANLEAHRLYAQGRGQLDHRTRSSLAQSLDSFQRAIETDPGNALAWAGLTEALAVNAFYSYSTREDLPAPIAAAERALKLDPLSEEAHAAHGILMAVFQNGPAAAKSLQQAIAINPSHAEAMTWLAWVRLCTGQADAALPLARRAAALNPLAPAIRIYQAEAELAAGHLRKAWFEARRGRELQPDYPLAQFTEALTLLHLDRPDRADTIFKSLCSRITDQEAPSRGLVQAMRGISANRLGRREQAQAILDELIAGADPVAAALLLAACDCPDAALEQLREAPEWRSPEIEIVRYLLPDDLGDLRKLPGFLEVIATIDRAWGHITDDGR
jgi:DNA-binding SARP family transcriptional activator/tetratricopeptide (TPR) repeat protein